MSDKTQIIQKSSEQLNATFNSLSDKLDLSAGELTKAFSYGFEKSVDYTFTEGILNICLGLLFLVGAVVSAYFARSEKIKNSSKDDDFPYGFVLFIACGICIFMASMAILNSIPSVLEPEGATILSFFKNAKGN